ncbi:MAG TPA: hypothetical protein VHI13_19525 [Candidatus Kapabacteria bacterium]|nr:hypothetical protein [Candidatus Kapabacteria bacterium]
MKTMIVVLLFAALSVTDAAAQWTRTNGPQGGEISAVAVDGNALIAGGPGGHFLRYENDRWRSLGVDPDEAAVRTLLQYGDTLLGASTFTIYRSVDRGLTWTAPVLDPHRPAAVYISQIAGNRHYLFAATSDSIYCSGDRGNSWHTVLPALIRPATDSSVEKNIAWIRADGDRLVAGVSGPAGIFDVLEFTTSDNGNTFTQSGVVWPPSGVSNVNILDLLLVGDTTYAATGEGGVAWSVNRGATWQNINSGLPLTGGHLADVGGFTVVRGAVWVRDAANLFYGFDGIRWHLVDLPATGDSYIPAIAATGKQIFAYTNLLYGLDTVATPHGWRDLTDSMNATRVDLLFPTRSGVLATTGPHGSHDGVVYRTTDGGMHWDPVFDAPFDHYDTNSTSIVAHVAMPVDVGGKRFYQHRLYRADRDGAHWDRVLLAAEDSLRTIYSSAFALDDSSLFVGFASFPNEHDVWSDGGLRRSTDGGLSWTVLDAGLPLRPGESVAPVFNLRLYEGNLFMETLAGTFRSADRGEHWTRINDTTGAIVGAIGSTQYALEGGRMYGSNDLGDHWFAASPLLNGAGGDTTDGSVSGVSVVGGAIYVAVDRTFTDRSGWVHDVWAFENGVWSNIRTTLPATEAFRTFAASGGTLFGGTIASGVWRHPLQAQEVREAQHNTGSVPHMTVAPNPCGARLQTHLLLDRSQDVTLRVIDALGRCVRTLQLGPMEPGDHSIAIDMELLPRGVYAIQCGAGDAATMVIKDR